MKALLFSIFIMSSIPALADTYTGVVSEVKHFAGGAVAVDLDGKYPHEKMALYLPSADVATIGTLPSEGTKITATGDVVQYKGRPEIRITSKSQWSWRVWERQKPADQDRQVSDRLDREWVPD